MKFFFNQVCKPLSTLVRFEILNCNTCNKSQVQFRAFASKPKKKFFQWQRPEGYDTGIRVLNSYGCLKQSKKKKLVPFVVNDKDLIKWYACGPTVYDNTHIGHASSYVNFDLVRRILEEYFDLNVFLVMGITDVDDKIINRAKLLDEEFLSLANRYEKKFQRDMELLNVKPPTSYAKVSEIIPQIISFIDELISTGSAYVGSNGAGNVWFNHSAIEPVGHLVAPLEAWDNSDGYNDGAIDKRNSQDFCLWKAAKPGDPYWEAPWGNGRPGWHIECSAASSLFFGDSLDVHTGGADLSFPHHECEIKQCEAYHNTSQWCNYFFHCGHLKMAGEKKKMSKSLGNVVRVKDFLEQYSADHMRLLCANNAWHADIHYSSEAMEEVDIQLRETKHFMNRCQQFVLGNMSGQVDSDNVRLLLSGCKKSIVECFRQNFNTQQAISCLLRLQNQVDPLLGDSVLLDNWKPSDHLRNEDSLCVGEVLDYMIKVYASLGFTDIIPSSQT